MSQKDRPTPDLRDTLKLKLPDLDVDTEQPWTDDVLDRTQIAARLTNLIRNQSAPFVVSIHGYWGTGKTFLLNRWQKDLENQGFRAIYFNAWEDDFCDDPLIAILGQLSQHFKEGPLKSLADKVSETALPLVWQNFRGVLEKHTGITLVLDQDTPNDPVKNYLSQRATTEDLKKHLTDMSAKVREETEHPLIFIIDELDRCRPTFAIELLERVKHIFDVPNMVFVFGINRDELCASLQSVYGNIQADIYLRRFFDLEFSLPEVDSEAFARHLMRKYGLNEFFRQMSANASHGVHTDEFNWLDTYVPALWGRFDLSLRDIDYCVRSIALVGRNLRQRSHMYPWLLALLIPVKLLNGSLYRQFIEGNCHASEVMDYIDDLPRLQGLDSRSANMLVLMEAYLYKAEFGYADFGSPTSSPWDQLRLLKNGEPLTQAEYLSKKTRAAGSGRANRLIEIVNSERTMEGPSETIKYVAHLIDLHQGFVRR